MPDAAQHLYWSRAPSNTPPKPKSLETAQQELKDASVSQSLWTPICKWGQRRDRVIITIFVPCLQKDAATVDCKPFGLEFRAERVATFAGNKREQRTYTLSLELLAEVNAEQVEIFLRHDHVRVELPKIVAKPWRTLQAANVPKSARPTLAHPPSTLPSPPHRLGEWS